MPPKTPAHLAHLERIVNCALSRRYEETEQNVQALVADLKAAGEVRLAARFEKLIPRAKAQFGLERLPIPKDQDSRLELLDIEIPVAEDAEVFLSREAGREIDRFVAYFTKRDQIIRAGLSVPNGVLLWGPPGVGKTQAARHIAWRTGLPLLTARLDAMLGSLLGSTGKNLRLIFEASKGQPVVLFLDEFDAVAKARDDQHEVGELKRVVNTLLQNIDRLPVGSVLVAATNHEQLLDRAVWRRFAFRVPLDNPDDDARRRMVATWLDGWGLTPLEFAELVTQTAGLSGAQIREAFQKAQVDAVVAGQATVTLAQLLCETRAAAPASTTSYA